MIRPLRAVALDLATATGLARTHDTNGEPRLTVDTIDTSLLPLHKKIDVIEYRLQRACGVPEGGGRLDLRVKPDVVVIEGTFSRPGAADYLLHALRGNVTQWLYRRGIPYVDVQPSTLKVWATGSGATRGDNKVGKDKVRAAIVATYGGLLNINPNDDDACDAVALLSMVLAQYGQPLVELERLGHTGARALEVPAWPELDLRPDLKLTEGNR